jgi:hypothetical protein
MSRRAAPNTSSRRAPVGGRGTPTGSKSNLADAGQIAHTLYVKLVAPGDSDSKSRNITLSALKYVHTRTEAFSKMGITVRVNRIRSQDLHDPRLVEAMRHRGITRLPALTTPNNVYIGLKSIIDIYERNLGEFAARTRRGESDVAGIEPESDLEAFYRGEMTFAGAEDDAQEAGMGEGDEMMNSYRHMMERRDSGGPPSAGRPAISGLDATSHATPGRPNNIRSSREVDPEDAEIQDTIDRLASDIDVNLRQRAFAGGGGDSLDDDGDGDSFQDDLMERSYYANMSNSEY